MIFQANARVERYEVSNKFYSCKMEENSFVSEYILRMSGYHNHLTQLGVNLPDDSVIDRVLQSLLMSTTQPSSCRRCWASKCRCL